MAILSGYKTYIIVFAFLFCVLLEKFVGFDIPGFAVGDDWLAMALGMLGIGTLRAGIAKVNQ